MKHIAALLLPMILFSGCLAAEESEKPLPKEMEPIVAELNSAKADATAKAIKKLQKVQVDLTKKGDLDGAMAAKKYIENLQKSLAFSVQGNGASDLPIVVLGEWGGRKDMKDDYTFNSDGSISWGKPEGHYKGTWKISKSKLVLTWKIPADWGEQTLTFSKDLTTLTCVAEEWSISKIK